jgi:hypothetical protein
MSRDTKRVCCEALAEQWLRVQTVLSRCSLEENGSTGDDVMQHFPSDVYDLFAGGQDDAFRAITDCPSAMFRRRFFLIAMRRNRALLPDRAFRVPLMR